jgi:hypothetical protein
MTGVASFFHHYQKRKGTGSKTSKAKGKERSPFYKPSVAAAHANKIILACLDEYDKQVVEPGKKRPPQTLESFRQSYVDLGSIWLTLQMLKMKKMNKKKRRGPARICFFLNTSRRCAILRDKQNSLKIL